MIRALHFSDIHVYVPFNQFPARDWAGKRLVGGASLFLARGKHFRDGREKLVALYEFAVENEVDLMLCTGDYTTLGTEVEMALAWEAVEPLTRAPLGYVTVPGNHDLYLADSVRENRFERCFADVLGSDLPEYRVDGTWPLVRLIGEDVVVVAVNSARPNPQPWRSSGRVPESQLRALARVLADPRLSRRFVFIMTHYAPRRRDGSPDTALHGLENADDLLRVCAEVPAGAFLHGHVHWCYHTRIQGVRPPLFGAGSLTHARREGFWLYEIDEHRLRAVPGRFENGKFVLEHAREVVVHR